MLTRLTLRRFVTHHTKLPSTNRLYRWLDIYEDFIGLKEVKQAQNAVNDV